MRRSVFSIKLERSLDFKRGKELRLREPGIAQNTLDLPCSDFTATWRRRARHRGRGLQGRVQEAARRVEGMRVGNGANFSTSRARTTSIGSIEMRSATPHLTLTAAPIDVAPQLRKLIFRRDNTAIMTSATLAVGDGLRYFVTASAARTRPRCKSIPLRLCKADARLHSPENARPAARDAYEGALAHWIKHFVSMTQGRRSCFSRVTRHAKAGRVTPRFFSQRENRLSGAGRLVARHRLLQKFKDRPRLGPLRHRFISGRASMCRARRSATSFSRGFRSPCRTIR